MTARGNVYDVHFDVSERDVKGTIKTPFAGFETINILAKTSIEASQASFDASLTTNDVTKFHLKSSINFETFAVDLKLETPFECLASLELNAGIIQVNTHTSI